MQETFAGNGATCVFSSAFFRAGVFRSRRRRNCGHQCLLWCCAVSAVGSLGACWPGQLGHGASSRCQLPRVRQAVGFHSAVWHRGSILLHRSWGVQRALLSVLHLAAACYRTVQPRGHFNLLRFLRRAAAVLNHSAVCYPQDCSAQGSLPLAVVEVSRFMEIMACTVGRQLA